MNEIKNVFKAETKRTLSGRIIPILLLVFVLFQLLAYFILFGAPAEQTEYSSDYIYTEASYEARLAQKERGEWLGDAEEYIPLYEFVKIQEKSDYGHYAAMPGAYSFGLGRTPIWTLSKIFSLVNFVLLLLSVFLAANLFREYANGGVKNYLIAGTRRDRVFWGKWLYLTAIIGSAFLFSLILGAAFGARYMGYKLLISVKGGVKTASFAQAFFTRAISFLFLLLFTASFTAFLTLKTKNVPVALALPYLLIVTFGILEFLFAKLPNIQHFDWEKRRFVLTLLPYFHAFLDPNPSFSWQLGAYFGADCALTAGTLALSVGAVRRQEI